MTRARACTFSEAFPASRRASLRDELNEARAARTR